MKPFLHSLTHAVIGFASFGAPLVLGMYPGLGSMTVSALILLGVHWLENSVFNQKV